jgi:hypothetical protein
VTVEAQFILTVSREEDENSSGITLESFGFAENEVLEALMRVAESIVQREIRTAATDVPFFAELPDEQRDSMISMQARLSMIEFLTGLDFVTAAGAVMDL